MDGNQPRAITNLSIDTQALMTWGSTANPALEYYTFEYRIRGSGNTGWSTPLNLGQVDGSPVMEVDLSVNGQAIPADLYDFRVRGYDDADAQRETQKLNNHLLTQPVFDLGMAGGILAWTPTASGRAFFTQTVDRLFNGVVDAAATTNISDPAKNYLDVTTMPGHVDTNRYSYRVTIRFTNPDTSDNHNGAGRTTTVRQFPMLPCIYIKSYARTDPHITVSFGFATDVYSGLGYEVEVRVSPTNAWSGLINSSTPPPDEPTVFQPDVSASAFYFRMRAKQPGAVGEWCAQTVGWSLNPPQSDPSALVYDISGDVVTMTFPATPASSPTNTNGTMVAVNHYFESGITDAYQKTSASEWGNVTVVQDQTSHEFGIGITALRTFIDTFDWAGITWNAHDGAVADRTVDKLYCVLFGVGSGLDTYNYLPKYYGIRLVAGHYLDGDATNDETPLVTDALPANASFSLTADSPSITQTLPTFNISPNNSSISLVTSSPNSEHSLQIFNINPNNSSISISSDSPSAESLEVIDVNPNNSMMSLTSQSPSVAHQEPTYEITPNNASFSLVSTSPTTGAEVPNYSVQPSNSRLVPVATSPTAEQLTAPRANRPTLVSATAIAVTFAWDYPAGANEDDITSIDIMRRHRATEASATLLTTLEPDARQYVDNAVQPDQERSDNYTYKVRTNVGSANMTSAALRVDTPAILQVSPNNTTITPAAGDPSSLTFEVAEIDINPDNASLTLVGTSPTVSSSSLTSVSPNNANLALTAGSPSANYEDLEFDITVNNASLRLQGTSPTAADADTTSVSPDNSQLALIAQSPSVDHELPTYDITPNNASTTPAASSPTTSHSLPSWHLSPPAASLVMSGSQPSVDHEEPTYTIAPNDASLELTATSPSIIERQSVTLVFVGNRITPIATSPTVEFNFYPNTHKLETPEIDVELAKPDPVEIALV